MRLLVMAVLSFLAFLNVEGKAHLWIRFRRFDNPGGRGDNGHCCDGKFAICPSKCDHRFIICVDYKYGRSDTSSCPYGKVVSGEITDKDSITFDDDIGGIKNPMIFDFDSWPGRVLLKIGVWDVDDNGDDFVDFLKQDVDISPAKSMSEATVQRMTIRDRVTLRVDAMVFCGPDSYGPTCASTCLAKSESTSGYTCDPETGRKICNEGWTGGECDISVDECLVNKCESGSTCVDGHLDYTCVCSPGYAGRFCETNVNECLSYPCQNEGTCEDRVNGYMCQCKEGWTGDTCEVRDACLQALCYHNGVCFNVNQTYVCRCPEGFAGLTCEIDLDECVSSPCLNGGWCENVEGSFQCHCSPGWIGRLCEKDLNECDSSPCVQELECINLQNNFSCVCLPGYTGRLCEQDIDECINPPCVNGGTCTNLQPSYKCKCPAGFKGRNCEKDVDECALSVCRKGSTCINKPGTFLCQCAANFTGVPRIVHALLSIYAHNEARKGPMCPAAGQLCETRLDTCVSQPCLNNGTCLDRGDGFQCACPNEWTGRACELPSDRCYQSPCANGATCRDLGRGQRRLCYCPVGWEGEFCEKDRNECEAPPCDNGGTCVNTPGSFFCACLKGWRGPLCQADVNECLDFRQMSEETLDSNSDLWRKNGEDQNLDNRTVSRETMEPICKNGGTCENVDGGFMCQCREGWLGPRCEDDVDECLTQPCRNGGQCRNYVGGFNCSCPDTWTGKVCETDVDECSGLPCPGHTECLNTPGGYSCVCPCGLKGEGCAEDMDECQGEVSVMGYGIQDKSCVGGFSLQCPPGSPCERGRMPCKNKATCENTFGAFVCRCTAGWSGLTCEVDIDECSDETDPGKFLNTSSSPVGTWDGFTATTVSQNASRNMANVTMNSETSSPGMTISPCRNGGVCQNLPGTFACLCPPDWTGRICEDDLNECLASPCRNGGTCLNQVPGYVCICPPSYSGRLCEAETETCDSGVCQNNATCIARDAQSGGGVQCICTRGWQGPHCDLDRDECLLQPCWKNGLCVNEEGSFRCQCPGNKCGSDTVPSPATSLPLWFNGNVGSSEILVIHAGINRFLEDYGGFRKDVTVSTNLQTQEGYDKEGNEITELSINITVENVTLSNEEVLEIMNRAPPAHLESYLPLPLYMGRMGKRIDESQGSVVQGPVVPWYGYLAMVGLAACAGLIIAVVCLKRVRLSWPRKRSDTSIMFMRNGVHGSGFDTTVDVDGFAVGRDAPEMESDPPPSTEEMFRGRDGPGSTPWSVEVSFPPDWEPVRSLSGYVTPAPAKNIVEEAGPRTSISSFLNWTSPPTEPEGRRSPVEIGLSSSFLDNFTLATVDDPQYSMPESPSLRASRGFDNITYMTLPVGLNPTTSPRPAVSYESTLPPPPIIVPVVE